MNNTYNLHGEKLRHTYAQGFPPIAVAYDVLGRGLNPFVSKTLSGGMDDTEAWKEHATTQRNAMIDAYNRAEDAIPFFIQTDGHGRGSGGNIGCQNLAEDYCGYITNIQLGDYSSYYADGANPAAHAENSVGIEKYITVMGNHEFLTNNPDATMLADLPTLIASYTPPGAILGSSTYGYYKKIDANNRVKYLVLQPYIPDSSKSAGFRHEITSDQYEWLIDELEADDGLDVVIIQHEPLGGNYVNPSAGTIGTRTDEGFNTREILAARKAKTSGSYTDNSGVAHSFDFRNCTTDLLCALHGHVHAVRYKQKAELGFPAYVGDWFGNNNACCYGLIDRQHKRLTLWWFNTNAVGDPIVLEL